MSCSRTHQRCSTKSTDTDACRSTIASHGVRRSIWAQVKSVEAVQSPNAFHTLSGEMEMALLFCVAMIIISLSLIHGLVHRRPMLILPYFIYMLFDFVVACLYTIGHHQWSWRVHQMAEDVSARLDTCFV